MESEKYKKILKSVLVYGDAIVSLLVIMRMKYVNVYLKNIDDID